MLLISVAKGSQLLQKVKDRMECGRTVNKCDQPLSMRMV